MAPNSGAGYSKQRKEMEETVAGYIAKFKSGALDPQNIIDNYKLTSSMDESLKHIAAERYLAKKPSFTREALSYIYDFFERMGSPSAA